MLIPTYTVRSKLVHFLELCFFFLGAANNTFAASMSLCGDAGFWQPSYISQISVSTPEVLGIGRMVARPLGEALMQISRLHWAAVCLCLWFVRCVGSVLPGRQGQPEGRQWESFCRVSGTGAGCLSCDWKAFCHMTLQQEILCDARGRRVTAVIVATLLHWWHEAALNAPPEHQSSHGKCSVTSLRALASITYFKVIFNPASAILGWTYGWLITMYRHFQLTCTQSLASWLCMYFLWKNKELSQAFFLIPQNKLNPRVSAAGTWWSWGPDIPLLLPRCLTSLFSLSHLQNCRQYFRSHRGLMWKLISCSKENASHRLCLLESLCKCWSNLPTKLPVAVRLYTGCKVLIPTFVPIFCQLDPAHTFSLLPLYPRGPSLAFLQYFNWLKSIVLMSRYVIMHF